MNETPPEPAAGQASAWLLSDVLLQKPPMLLLDAILSHGPDETSCSVHVGPSSPFADEEGSIQGFVALEYMAQCAAAHSGLCAREQGLPVRIGLLLGSRRVQFHVACFHSGQELEICARSTWSDGELASFACTVRDRSAGTLLAECELTAYSPPRVESVLEKQRP